MKTIQEAFLEIYFEQDPNYPNEKKYRDAIVIFKEKYNLAPPYKSFRSFLQILYKRPVGDSKGS